MQRGNSGLFCQGDLDDWLRGCVAAAVKAVDAIPQAQFLASSDTDVVATIVSQGHIEPIKLLEDHARMSEPQESQVDISQDPNRFFGAMRPDRHFIAGTTTTVTIPYTGDYPLWKLKTNPWRMTIPEALVTPPTGNEPGKLKIILSAAHDADHEVLKRELERTLDDIRWFINTGRTQIEGMMRALPGAVQTAAAARRVRLAKQAGLASLLNIPLEARPGVPSITPIIVEQRITITLPPPPKSGFKPEPGISLEMFDKILGMLRHNCQTFERTPHVYAPHPEEDLRDMLLAHLNGYFRGKANGEAFRKSGKTDITIEQETRAAFVAECKIWEGPKKLDDGLDQLLSYLTWRDCKAALLIFNKSVKGFSQLLETVPSRLRAHPNYVSKGDHGPAGDWRFVMRSQEDEGRRVTVQVMLFNLWTPQ